MRFDLQKYLRVIEGFPKPGIAFYDINPLLGNPKAFAKTMDTFVEQLDGLTVEKVCGVESRGFIFAVALAQRLNVGFVPIRKKGKLPGKIYSVAYALEYGQDCLEIQQDALHSDESVILIDDVLATGGTARAAIHLIEQCSAHVAKVLFLLELSNLQGRDKLKQSSVDSLLIL